MQQSWQIHSHLMQSNIYYKLVIQLILTRMPLLYFNSKEMFKQGRKHTSGIQLIFSLKTSLVFWLWCQNDLLTQYKDYFMLKFCFLIYDELTVIFERNFLLKTGDFISGLHWISQIIMFWLMRSNCFFTSVLFNHAFPHYTFKKNY